MTFQLNMVEAIYYIFTLNKHGNKGRDKQDLWKNRQQCNQSHAVFRWFLQRSVRWLEPDFWQRR